VHCYPDLKKRQENIDGKSDLFFHSAEATKKALFALKTEGARQHLIGVASNRSQERSYLVLNRLKNEWRGAVRVGFCVRTIPD
jgi:hypothetical protein